MQEIVTSPQESVGPALIAARLSSERAPDIVEALNELEPEVAAAVLQHFGLERTVEVLDLPELEHAADIVQNLPLERAVPLLTSMSADRLADVVRQMEGRSSKILPQLDPDTQGCSAAFSTRAQRRR